MNRKHRRAKAAAARAAAARHTAVRDAIAYLAAVDDPTVTGATIATPDGQILHLDMATVRAMAVGVAGENRQ